MSVSVSAVRVAPYVIESSTSPAWPPRKAQREVWIEFKINPQGQGPSEALKQLLVRAGGELNVVVGLPVQQHGALCFAVAQNLYPEEIIARLRCAPEIAAFITRRHEDLVYVLADLNLGALCGLQLKDALAKIAVECRTAAKES